MMKKMRQMLYQYLYKPTQDGYNQTEDSFSLHVQNKKKMSHTLQFALSLSLLGLTFGGNSLQTDIETKVDLLKSLIYDNTKATVTLDSTALKQLIKFSSGNLWNNLIPLNHIFISLLPIIYVSSKVLSMLIVQSFL